MNTYSHEPVQVFTLPACGCSFWMRICNQQVLKGAGSVKHDDMKRIANDRYVDFDQKRRQQEAIEFA